jgi:hypothetical protein
MIIATDTTTTSAFSFLAMILSFHKPRFSILHDATSYQNPRRLSPINREIQVMIPQQIRFDKGTATRALQEII